MKKKICFFSPTTSIGGAEKNLINMCRYLPKTKYNLIVVLPPGGILNQVLKKMSIRTIHISKYFLLSGQIFNVLFGCLLLWTKLRKEKIDIIHSNSIFTLYLPLYYGNFFRIPVFIHWADFDVRKGDRQIVNLFSKNTTVIAVSRSIQKALIDNGIKPEIIKLIYNGVEEPHLDNALPQKIFKKQIEANEKDILIGITGRIDSWKGHEYAIRALAKTKKLSTKLVILGEFHTAKNKNLKSHLLNIVTALNLESKVIFLGFVENSFNVVNLLNIVLIPSEYEPFGLVAIEAMALKKPVIASNVGGLAEIITDHNTGLLVPPKNADAISDALQTLVDNQKLAIQYGENGYKRYKKEFTIQHFIANLEAIYG